MRHYIDIYDHEGTMVFPRYTVVVDQEWVFLMSEHPERQGLFGTDLYIGKAPDIRKSGREIKVENTPEPVLLATQRRIGQIERGALPHEPVVDRTWYLR